MGNSDGHIKGKIDRAMLLAVVRGQFEYKRKTVMFPPASPSPTDDLANHLLKKWGANTEWYTTA